MGPSPYIPHLPKRIEGKNNQMNEIKYSIFFNKWTFSKTFIDDNGKQKLFIIPMNEKEGYDRMNFTDAVNYCAKLNSTLLDNGRKI